MPGSRRIHLALLPLLTLLPLLGCASPQGDGPDESPDEDLAINDAALQRACAAAKKIEWGMHWKDDFDSFDESRWNRWERVVPDTTTCQKPDAISITDGGKLRIATRDVSTCPGLPHTGGGLHTYGKFWTGKYFKAEVRAKVSQEEGIFGAPLWFRPGDATGDTHVGGEIDVMESLGTWKHPRFQMTLHPAYEDTASKFVHEKRMFEDFGDPKGTEFHVYTVEKVPNGITFYVDDKYAAGWGCGDKRNRRLPAYYQRWFEDLPSGWSVRIDNKVGGNWAGAPDKTTDWGHKTAMLVDYIKVWRPR